MNRLFRLAPWCMALLASACTASNMGGDAGMEAAVPPPTPPMACRAGTRWDGTTPLFRDATQDWGLGDVRGVRVSTADIDNDGFSDLVVVGTGTNTRAMPDAMMPQQRGTRLLMNRPREGGGRTFVEATRSSNFLATREEGTYGRVVNLVGFADVDNDGDLDAYTGVYVALGSNVPTDPGDRSEIMINDGQGRFTLAPTSDATPTIDEAPQTSGLAWTDWDRDGKIDAFVGYFYDPGAGLEIGQQPDLFRGRGDGTFERANTQANLTLGDTMASFATAAHRRPLYGATACDVNGDGTQDLLGAAYGRQWNELFLSGAMGRYTEVGRASGIGGDENQNFMGDQSYWCYCRTASAMCPMMTPEPNYTCPLRGWRLGYNDQPWRLNGNTFSIACGDVDNDGDNDLFTAEIAHPDTGPASDRSELLLNNGMTGMSTAFTRPGRANTGIRPGSSDLQDEGGIYAMMFDFDMDGRLDLWLGATDYPGQFGWLFRQGTDGKFTEISRTAGFQHACPTGVGVADYDNDGDLDVIVGSSTARDCARRWRNGNEVHIYENLSEAPNWTRIRLVGRGTGGANRSAIGARVRVTTGTVTQQREVVNAYGHFAQTHELPVHFGLGSNCVIDRIEVRWPDAMNTVETFTNIPANYHLEIRQGEGFVRYPGR